MQRNIATKLLRDLLDENNLQHWHVRLTMDMTKPFLGLCSYKDKCIILNAHHIDTHPDVEIINTIRHEVAHALCPNEGHNAIWADKARKLGCDNTMPCATYDLLPLAIDAIRSGADLKVEFEEQVIRTPKYAVTRLQDKCPQCGKVAKTKSIAYSKANGIRKRLNYLECGHLVVTDADSQSPFEDLVFDITDPNCKHEWNKNECILCKAHRLYPFQVDGARALERANGRLAILDEMGLGKGIQAIGYLKYHRADAWPFCWVTKSGPIYQHAHEIMRILGPEAFPQVITSGKWKVIPGMNAICSYDMFRRTDLDQFANFKTLILDECQAIKNPDSTRTQCIRRIAKQIPKVIPTSGTFWKNRGSEAFVMCNILDPKMFYSFETFKRDYVEYYWDGNKKKEGGLRKDFMKRISHIAIRRERQEVLPELPLVNRTQVLVDIPEAVRKAYQQEEDSLMKLVDNATIGGDEDTFGAKSAIMQSLMVMRQIIGIAKVPATIEYAQDFLEETDRKLVIFINHIKCGDLMMNTLSNWCAENDLPQPMRILGGMPSAERFAIQDKFNKTDKQLLIASTLASGEGLNLQTCSDCIMHERQWNPANEEQAEGRFVRIGQLSNSVNAIYIHADDTCDTILHHIVERKRVAFHNSMNKGEMPQWNESDILNELIDGIRKRRNERKRK